MGRRLVRQVGSGTLRQVSWLLVAVTFLGLILTFVVRGAAAGADADVYWTAARTWIAGGDPYDLPGDTLPYVYAPWGLPLFLPWALLPWDAAFTVWRVAILAALAASVHWAVLRRPISGALTFAALAIPIGINLDTGNITLPLALLIFGARFVSRRTAGVAWGLATGLKWATLPLAIILSTPARRWGLATLGLTVVLSLATWPMTLDQLRTIASLERPFPIDYLVLAWAAVPWLWKDPSRRRWLRPSTWRTESRATARSVVRAIRRTGFRTPAAGS